ncbi:hypothetical protein ACFL6S_10720 [Candidatus Poribacteria bacterium]
MRAVASVFLLLSVFVLVTSSAYAYIYFVEADEFDPDRSELAAAGATWEVKEGGGDPIVKEASGEKYMECGGGNHLAATSLMYPIPAPENNATVTIWLRCRMHNTGHDSFFFYFSDDDGKNWTNQIKGSGGGGDPAWQWKTWSNTVNLKEDGDNLLRVAERESATLDVICLRDDGLTPTDAELAAWLEAQPVENIAVNPLNNLSTTWGSIKY